MLRPYQVARLKRDGARERFRAFVVFRSPVRESGPTDNELLLSAANAWEIGIKRGPVDSHRRPELPALRGEGDRSLTYRGRTSSRYSHHLKPARPRGERDLRGVRRHPDP